MTVEKLKQFMHHPLGQASQTKARYQREVAPRPTLGTINVIFATPSRGVVYFQSVISVASKLELKEQIRESKKVRLEALTTLGFCEEDMVRTLQPHDDALVVTLQIRGYYVKRVLID